MKKHILDLLIAKQNQLLTRTICKIHHPSAWPNSIIQFQEVVYLNFDILILSAAAVLSKWWVGRRICNIILISRKILYSIQILTHYFEFYLGNAVINEMLYLYSVLHIYGAHEVSKECIILQNAKSVCVKNSFCFAISLSPSLSLLCFIIYIVVWYYW